MPNWCENTLTVSGYDNPKQFKKFVSLALKNPKKENENSTPEYPLLSNLVPMPKELENTESPNRKPIEEQQPLIEKYGFSNWYDWAVGTWGTKWDVNARTNYTEGDEEIIFDFDSAWSPPIEWLEKVCKQFPELDFKLKYEESGMGFMGIAVGSQGDLSDQCISY